MTSKAMQSRRRAARDELTIFNRLPRAVRDAINLCEAQPPKASVVLNALLRGVPEETVIETIKRSRSK